MISIQIDEPLASKLRAAKKVITKPRVRNGAVLAALLIPMTLVAAPVIVPNQFASGQPSSAADVNANFDALAIGINDNDSRINTLVASNPTPSATGVSAYVTTRNNDGATIADSFNSSGGAVSLTGNTGDYAATFNDVQCVENTMPVGIATVVPYVTSLAATCRISTITQIGNNCRISVRCFNTTGSLRAGPVAIEYRR